MKKRFLQTHYEQQAEAGEGGALGLIKKKKAQHCQNTGKTLSSNIST